MKELEPKPICWQSESKDCYGPTLDYGFMERPEKKVFELCDFHAKPMLEAITLFTKGGKICPDEIPKEEDGKRK